MPGVGDFGCRDRALAEERLQGGEPDGGVLLLDFGGGEIGGVPVALVEAAALAHVARIETCARECGFGGRDAGSSVGIIHLDEQGSGLHALTDLNEDLLDGSGKRRVRLILADRFHFAGGGDGTGQGLVAGTDCFDLDDIAGQRAQAKETRDDRNQGEGQEKRSARATSTGVRHSVEISVYKTPLHEKRSRYFAQWTRQMRPRAWRKSACLEVQECEFDAAVEGMGVLAQMVDGVDAHAGDEIHGGDAAGPWRATGAAPAHDAEGFSAEVLDEGETDVAVLDDARSCGEGEPACEEDRLCGAHAEGLAESDPAQQFGVDLVSRQFQIAEDGGLKHLRLKEGAGVQREALPQQSETIKGQGKADGVGVAAEAGEKIGAGSACTAVRASSRWKPSMERPEPCASRVRGEDKCGRPVRSTTREARMPRTPRCHSGWSSTMHSAG